MTYIKNQNEIARNAWLSANAIQNDIQSKNEIARNTWLSADQQQSANEWLNAVQNPTRPSTPYVIRLVNACTSAIANVDVGDSYANRAADFNPAAGPWNFNQNSNITITSIQTGTSYIEFLAQTERKPFKVGKTIVICTTAAQFNETLTVTHRDANGKRKDDPYTMTIDPYQTQTDRFILDADYLFDGYTRLRFSNIALSATVTIQFYPKDEYSPLKLVAMSEGEHFKAPRLIKVLPVAKLYP